MGSFTSINNRNTLPSFQQMASAGWNLDNVSETTNASTSAMAQQSVKKYLCSVEGCGKSYGSTSGLRKHTQSIHENITYSCREVGCDKSYNRLENLNRHIQSNHIGARYYCPVENCGKDYSDPSSVNSHVKANH